MSIQIHDGRITHIDRLALSNALYEIAETFAEMSTRWRPETGIPADMQRQARLLAQVARSVLSPVYPYAKGEAFHDAGRHVLANERAAWEFFRTVATPPNTRARREAMTDAEA